MKFLKHGLIRTKSGFHKSPPNNGKTCRTTSKIISVAATMVPHPPKKSKICLSSTIPHSISSAWSTQPQHPNFDPSSLCSTPLILKLSSSLPRQYNKCTPIVKHSMLPVSDGCAHHSRSLQSLCEYSAATTEPVS